MRLLERIPPSGAALRKRLELAIEETSPDSTALALDSAKQFDKRLHDRLAASGIFAIGTPEQDGGAGGDTVDQVIVLETLGRKATSMAVFCVVRFLVVRMLRQFGSEDQKNTYLPSLLAGTTQSAFCLTEEGGGTDILASTKTTAVADGQGWVLSGSKAWISGAASSDMMLVVARTDAHRTRGLTVFVVPRHLPGIAATRTGTIALNGYETCSVTFERVRLPKDSVLGTPGMGLQYLLSGLNSERINAAAVVGGIARGAFERGVERARTRTAFEKPIGQFQAVQHRLASLGASVEMAWMSVLEAARRDADGEPTDIVASLAKWAASKAALSATDIGMELMGASGFLEQDVMQRYFRDARLHVFAPVNNDMILNILGERWLGLPRSF